MPISKVIEPNENDNNSNFVNPILQNKPVSIETALIYGETDRFYYIIDPDENAEDNSENNKLNYEDNDVIGLSVVNIEYDNDLCSMILFRNWTHNFKY